MNKMWTIPVIFFVKNMKKQTLRKFEIYMCIYVVKLPALLKPN